MKISDKYEVVQGPKAHDFMLLVHTEGKDKQGNPKITTKQTYHPTLQQVWQKIARLEGIGAIELESVQMVLDKLDQMIEELKKHET